MMQTLLEQRKKNILARIVAEHIRTQEAVSSQYLAEFFGLSPATIRNEMAELSELGYLTQPHVSSGRIPTEEGFRYYAAQKIPSSKMPPAYQKLVNEVLFQSQNYESLIRTAVRILSEFSHETAFAVFENGDVFIAGISHLVSKPEFQRPDEISEVAAVIDVLENQLFERLPISHGFRVVIGSENPVSIHCASLVCDYEMNNHRGLIGILGPMRMDYGKNHSLVSYLFEQMHDRT